LRFVFAGLECVFRREEEQTDVGIRLAHMLHNEPEPSCGWDGENPWVRWSVLKRKVVLIRDSC
jgi:hypothetical protein